MKVSHAADGESVRGWRVLRRKKPLFLAALAFFCLAVDAGTALAQSDAEPRLSEEEFEKRSLALRTALHHDALLEEPLEALFQLYSEAGRTDELIALYRDHVANYPDDTGSMAVLIRTLRLADRPEAGQQTVSAANRHPESAALHYLLYQYLDRNADPRALVALSTAIDLQKRVPRKREWIVELLENSREEEERSLASDQLAKLLGEEGQTGADLLALARTMQRYEFWELSLATVGEAVERGLDPEAGVEAEILAARAEAALDQPEAAGKRLDEVLAMLAPDHWRRPEVFSLRVSVFASEEEREKLLANARSAYEEEPSSERAALDYADHLAAAERRKEARRVLAESSLRLTESAILERRALEEFRRDGASDGFVRFLEGMLELHPERSPLRFELVKALFALGRNLEAHQDLKSVLAGLDGAEASALLLELARHLQSIDRSGPAAEVLAAYVRENPDRLDVVRELVELHLENGNEKAARDLLAGIEGTEGEGENFLDLAAFLAESDFLPAAQRLTEARFRAEPENFEAGLLLLGILAESGDPRGAEERTAETRKMADTPERYRRWLEASLAAHAKFERAGSFFDSEESRYAYSGEEWTPERVGRFLALCEVAGARRLSDRVANALRSQLEAEGVDGELRLRLRRLLVEALADRPESAAEVEDQLALLAEEDPEREEEYRLRLAVAHHRAGRIAEAEEGIAAADWEQVGDAGILRDALPLALEYGYLHEAGNILAAINRLEPNDVFSWEKRLALLAASERERDFRAVVRELLGEGSRLRLRESSRSALRAQMLDSYWRSISEIVSGGRGARILEALPLLDAADREPREARENLWLRWTRACVLRLGGREEEAAEAMESFHELAVQAMEKPSAGEDSGQEGATLAFPDGLSLPLEQAEQVWKSLPLGGAGEPAPLPEASAALQQAPAMRWAYELEPGARLSAFRIAGPDVLALDNRGRVHRIDRDTGKRIWRKSLGLPPVPMAGGGAERAGQGRPGEKGESGNGDISATDREAIEALCSRGLETDGERFFLAFGDELRAYRIADGELAWKAPLLDPEPGKNATAGAGRNGSASPAAETFSAAGALPRTSLALAGERVFAISPRDGLLAAFGAANGKLLWQQPLGVDPGVHPDSAGDAGGTVDDDRAALFSLNTGLSADRDRVFAYGERAAVFDAATGELSWSFDGHRVEALPAEIREERFSDEGEGEDRVLTFAGESGRTDGERDRPAESGHGDDSDGSRPLFHPPGRTPLLFDHLHLRTADAERASAALGGPSLFLAPAVRWARARLHPPAPAAGRLADGHLWLMDRRGLLRISLALPLAARQLPARGAFLGAVGKHAWFLEKDALVHADFRQNRSRRHPLGDLAGEGDLRGRIAGARVHVRGERGVRIFNAYTGHRVAEWDWPEVFGAYLAEETVPRGDGEAPPHTWDGAIGRSAPGHPRECVPLLDEIEGSDYLTSFGRRVLVMFGDALRAREK